MSTLRRLLETRHNAPNVYSGPFCQQFRITPQWPHCIQRKSAPIWGIHVLNLNSLADRASTTTALITNDLQQVFFLTREHQHAIITITTDKAGLRSARIVAGAIVATPSDLPFSQTRKLFPIESRSLQSVLDFEIVWLDKIQTLTYQRYFAVDSAVEPNVIGCHKKKCSLPQNFTKNRSLTHLACRVMVPSGCFFKTNGSRFDTTIKLLLGGLSAAVIVISHCWFWWLLAILHKRLFHLNYFLTQKF